MKQIGTLCVIGVLAGMWLKMDYWGLIMVEVVYGLVGICLQKMANEEKHKQTDFHQITEYMQNLAMAFSIAGSEYAALKETIPLFDKGKMKRALTEALRIMEDNREGTGGMEAFAFMEGKYPCKKLQILHRYILTVVSVGGEGNSSIQILINDQEMWKKRQLLSYEDLCRDKRKIGISILLTIGLCGYVSRLTGKDIQITDTLIYQIGAVAFALGCLGVWVLACRTGKMDWLEEKNRYSQSEIREKVMRFQKEQSRHRVGYETRKAILRNELIQAFPEWILEIALRIQSKNVEVALEESYETAPEIIRPSLQRMLKELKDSPGQGDAYFQFAKEYQVPEITTSMKILYGISRGAIGEGREQIGELVSRNYQLEDHARVYRQERTRSVMFGYSLAPSLLGAGCMILNMSLLLVEFMGSLKL